MLYRTVIGMLVAGAASSVAAQEDYSYPYGHLSRVEGEVTVQRASEPEPEPGATNVPVMPGDRLWTNAHSRAEVAFADGTLVRVDERTKVDFVELDSELIFRMWSGSVIVRIDDPRVAMRIDSPAGSVYPAGGGTYRIDVDEERLMVSAMSGSAELAAPEGSVIVDAGNQSYVVAGSEPSPAYAFNTARLDAFADWSESLDVATRNTQDIVVRSLPREVHHYARGLHHHGAWYQEADYGYVWYPSVSASWSPYRHGRWRHTRYGYTWISYEPWGWAPYHYGRWGYGHRGWYWIPGAHWGPAWVSFAIGPTWVGWSPLGYHGRSVFRYDSVFYPDRRYRGGRAVPRHVYDDGAGWNFVGQQQFTARSERARLRASDVRASAGRARVWESGAVLNRDLSPSGSASGVAVPRALTPRSTARQLTQSPLRSQERTNGATSGSARGRAFETRGGGEASRRTPSERGREGGALRARTRETTPTRGALGTGRATTRPSETSGIRRPRSRSESGASTARPAPRERVPTGAVDRARTGTGQRSRSIESRGARTRSPATRSTTGPRSRSARPPMTSAPSNRVGRRPSTSRSGVGSRSSGSRPPRVTPRSSGSGRSSVRSSTGARSGSSSARPPSTSAPSNRAGRRPSSSRSGVGSRSSGSSPPRAAPRSSGSGRSSVGSSAGARSGSSGAAGARRRKN